MTKSESLQHKLDRVRAPRVHISYDIETGDQLERKEIPFVVGALADLSGKPQDPLPRLKDRKFVEIDRDNFDCVLEAMKPRVVFNVDNKLAADGCQLRVELCFKTLGDFHPESVVQQVEPLRELVETRRKLSELLNKLDGNDRFGEILQAVIASSGSLKQLGIELGVAKSSDQESAE